MSDYTVSMSLEPITYTVNFQEARSATIQVGTITTGAAGSSVVIENVGTASAAVLNITIPRGNTGAAGSAASIAIGTITTGAPGSSAVVTNVGTANAAIFNFTIPSGLAGTNGSDASVNSANVNAAIAASPASALSSLGLHRSVRVLTAAVTSNNGIEADIAEMMGLDLQANSTYRLTLWSIITTASGGSFEFIFRITGTTFLGGTAQAGAGVQRSGAVLNGGYHYSNTAFSPLYATQNLSNAPTYGEYYFRTGPTTGTGNLRFSQRPSAVVGVTSIAAGTTLCLEKIS